MPTTIVQHSAAGYNNDPRFTRGLEMRTVTAKQAEKISKAGGLLFDEYNDASKFEHEAMYPDGVQDMIPQARGMFSRFKIDGLKIYLPTIEDRALINAPEMPEADALKIWKASA